MNLGQWAEQQALKLAELQGYALVQANYHSPYGEIDLIVQRGQELLLIEVKARKQRKMLKTALHFFSARPELQQHDWRFDVICFDFYQRFAKSIQQDFSNFTYDQQWIENAFTFDQEFINL